MKIIGTKQKDITYTKRDGVYAIIERKQDEKIAIATNGNYFFLGGGIEQGETELEALTREIKEESGYTIKSIEYFDTVASYLYSQTRGYLDVTATFYIAEFDEKVAEPIEKDHQVLWVNPSEYKDKIYHEYQRYILEEYIKIKSKNSF